MCGSQKLPYFCGTNRNIWGRVLATNIKNRKQSKWTLYEDGVEYLGRRDRWESITKPTTNM